MATGEGKPGGEVVVGTPHTFRGAEAPVMIFDLVKASRNTRATRHTEIGR